MELIRRPLTPVVLREASADFLTGAFPKALFEEKLRAEAKRALQIGMPLSLLMIDIDHFKSVNDAFGHGRGDEVLREFGRRVRVAAPLEESFFRLGGDEFAVLLSGVAEEEAFALGQRILEAVCSTPFSGEPSLEISLSIGVATIPADADASHELFKRADLRLYEAKRRGRGRVAAGEQRHTTATGMDPIGRMIEGDERLDTLAEFFDGLSKQRRGVLSISGVRGSGRTRTLAEVTRAAQLRGCEVLAVTGTQALGGRSRGALLDAHPLYEDAIRDGAAAFAAELCRILREEERTHLVIAVDDLPYLDRDTLELLQQLLDDPQIQALAVVWTQLSGEGPLPGAPAAPFSRALDVRALTPTGLRTWLRNAVCWEAPQEFLSWMHEETQGLPGRIESGLARLLSLGVLRREPSGCVVDPQYRDFSIRAWHEGQSELRTSNIPPVLSSILGRDVEIRQAKELLRTERLLTFTGPGGYGKTRLAIQVAAELSGDGSSGVFFVPLAPLNSPDQIANAIAEALRISLRAGVPPKEQLKEYLQNRELLLVLDNFEHVMAGVPLVSELISAAPGVRVLATSRERLNLNGETVLQIRGMPVPESDDPQEIQRSPAVQLFAQHAGRHRTDLLLGVAEWRIIAQISRRLDGIPLAIEISAGLIKVLSCEEILVEIGRDLDALVTTSRDAPERHRSLRSVFDYSWSLLNDRERLVWTKLSVFANGFRREAAQEVAGAGLPVLAVLTDKSLLHPMGGGRFEIHEVLRRYALEQLSGSAEEEARTRAGFCRYFAELVYGWSEKVDTGGAGNGTAEVGAEMENIRQAYTWVLEGGDHDAAERITKGLFRFYDLTGRFQEGAELFADTAGALGDGRLRGVVLARQGYFCSKLGRNADAKRLHRRSIKLLRAIGADDETALPLYSLATVMYEEGEYARAERLYRRSAKLYRESRSRAGLALCLNNWGMVVFLQGRHEQAETLFRSSLKIRLRIGDAAGQAKSYTNLGMVADVQGNLPEARRCFEQSLDAARRAGDRRSIAGALNNLGVLARRIGEEEGSPRLLAEAEQFLQQALEVYEEIGARGGAALVLSNLGDIACLTDRYVVAEQRQAEAIRRAEEMGAMGLLTAILLGVAKLRTRTGGEAQAVELLSLVLHHSASSDDSRQTAQQLLPELEAVVGADVFRTLSGVGATRDAWDAAREILRGAQPRPEQGPAADSGEVPVEGSVEEEIERGKAAERSAQQAVARAHYESALHRLREPSDAALAAPLIRWIGKTYLAEGEIDAAEDCFEASLAIGMATRDRTSVAHASNLQGVAAYQRCDYDTAVLLYTEAKSRAEGAQEPALVAMIEHNLGIVARVRGDLYGTLRHCHLSLGGFQAIGAEENVQQVLNSLGLVYTDLRQWGEAERSYEQALEGSTRLGDLAMQLKIGTNQAELWIAQGEYARARTVCDANVQIAEAIQDRRTIGEIEKHYGVIFREFGDLPRSEIHLARAAVVADEQEDLLLAAEVAREQAGLFLKQNNNREVLERLNLAHRLFSQLQATHRVADLQQRTADFQELFVQAASRWSESITAVDPYTRGHCDRVAELACGLARASGMDEETLFWFRLGGLLHDLGKTQVDPAVLNKPGRLDSEEREAIERHPDAGVELLGDLQFPWNIRPMVRFHHERYAGGGYPTGITGEEIPLSARILCIADVYDALTSDRPYRKGFPHEKAMSIMETEMSGHFDPELFACFKGLFMARPAHPVGETSVWEVAESEAA